MNVEMFEVDIYGYDNMKPEDVQKAILAAFPNSMVDVKYLGDREAINDG